MSDISRRLFIKTTVSATMGLSLQKDMFSMSVPDNNEENRIDQPNILVIMSDQHNANVLGCYGNKIVNTPNLDRLAKSGITFDNFYCNSPLCVPSRLSFTAGKYVSRINAWSNANQLPSDDYPSIASIMKSAGYDAYLCGKMHYAPNHRYGFTEIGKLYSNQKSKSGIIHRRKPDDFTEDPSEKKRFEDFYTGNNSRILDHDREVSDLTVNFIKNRKSTKPFFMISGLLAPHEPLIVPEEYWKKYQDKVPMPEIPENYIENLPLNYKHLRLGFGVTDIDAETVKKGRELYYGLVEWMDKKVGEILNALKECGLDKNTIVIYTTDHGENMGEHGLWWKNAMFDSATRIPLIISWPKKWKGGQRRLEIASLLDVVQTIAEIGKAKVPDDWDGDSMCKWLDDEKYRWKDFAISEYYAHNIASGYVMIRKGKYKYVYHTPADSKHHAQRELYDIEKDPNEFHNLAGQKEYEMIITKLHDELCSQLKENPDNIELRARADFQNAKKRNQKQKK